MRDEEKKDVGAERKEGKNVSEELMMFESNVTRKGRRETKKLRNKIILCDVSLQDGGDYSSS